MWKDAALAGLRELEVAMRRFPLPALLTVAIWFLSLLEILPSSELLRFGILWFSGAALFVSLTLVAESRGWGEAAIYWIGLPVFAALSAYLLLFDAEREVALFGYGLWAAIFVAPYLRAEANSDQLWAFDYALSLRSLFVAIAALALFIGVSAILGAMNYLFGLRLWSLVFEPATKTILLLFAPLAFLAGIPTWFYEEKDSLPKGLRWILAYIVVPVLAIYTLILYAYILKIVFSGTLPDGGVANLVAGYACTGMAAYLISYPLRYEGGVIGVFRRYFFPALLAPLALLAAAIGMRVYIYGFTEERYLLVLFLVWLLLAAGYWLFARRDDAPRFILVSLTALWLAAAFGPWGAVGLSTWDQVSRLQDLLQKNGLLEKGRIVPADEARAAKVGDGDRAAISSITDYLARTDKLEAITPWFENIPDAAIREARRPSFGGKKIVEDMGIAYLRLRPGGTRATSRSTAFSFTSGPAATEPLQVEGYDYLANWFYSGNAAAAKLKLGSDTDVTEFEVRFDDGDNTVIVSQGSEEVVLPLGPLIDRLIEKEKQDKERRPASGEMQLEGETDGFAVRLLIDRVHGAAAKDEGEPNIHTLSTRLLIRLKG